MSALEDLKASSDFLRGNLAAELAAPDEKLGADASHLIKFHGLYQQKERDKAPAADFAALWSAAASPAAA